MPKSRFSSFASNYPRADWAESENPWLYGGLSRVLDIDPLVSVSSITVDEGRDNTFSRTLVASDYELLPRNAAQGPEPEPYRQIFLTNYGTLFGWPSQARVKVHGIFGWPSVPVGIRDGCIELAGILLGDSPLATRQYTDMGAVGASTEARGIVRGLIESHTRMMAF